MLDKVRPTYLLVLLYSIRTAPRVIRDNGPPGWSRTEPGRVFKRDPMEEVLRSLQDPNANPKDILQSLSKRVQPPPAASAKRARGAGDKKPISGAGDKKTSSEVGDTKPSSEAGGTKSSSEAGETNSSSEASDTKLCNVADDKTPNKKPSSSGLTLTGGVPQPPRVIGYWRTGAHADLTFRVEKRSFATQSQVIAPCCGLIARLVTTAGTGSPAGRPPPVELPGKAAAFEALLDYFYLGECTFPENLLEPVLELAHHLQAYGALQGSLSLFNARLTPSTALAALQLALRLSMPTMRAAAEQMARDQFDTVRVQPEFGLIPEEFLRSLLADDSLGIRAEQSAFEAVTSWIEAQKPSPATPTIAALLRLVRYPSLPRSYLTENVLPHPLFQALPGGAAAILLNSYVDAHYSPASTLCTHRRHVGTVIDRS